MNPYKPHLKYQSMSSCEGGRNQTNIKQKVEHGYISHGGIKTEAN